MITVYIKETIDYILDHFQREAKRHFNLSFLFVLIVMLWTSFVLLIYGVSSGYLFGYLHFTGSLSETVQNAVSNGLGTKIYELSVPLTIMCCGLYGSFVISCINDIRLQSKDKYTWSDFKEFISKDDWNWFLKLNLVLFLIYLISFEDLSEIVYGREAISKGFWPGMYGQESAFSYHFIRWLDSMISLIKTYLPYFFVALFIIAVYENKLSATIIRKYKNSIVSSLILGFVINTLAGIAIGYFNRYVVGLLDTVMYTSVTTLLPGAIRFGLMLTAAAYINWTLAAAFCMPVKLLAEADAPTDDDFSIDNNATILEEEMDDETQ